MKSKKGQILILTLIVMAVGLIVISPMLSYLHTSYNLFTSEINDAKGYLVADAMMELIVSDLYAGEDIYVLNNDESDRYNQDSWLNDFDIRTVVNNSMASPPAPPSGGQAYEVYMDPGCSFGLNELEYNDTHEFPLYLTDNTTVTVNWYFNDEKERLSCNYFCNGSMWISNGSDPDLTESSATVLSNGSSTAFQQQLIYTVPQGGRGNYIIHFKNLATRGRGSSCSTQTRDMDDFDATTDPPSVPTFNGAGDIDPDYLKYTWVHLVSHSQSEGVYQDYTIITTASINDEDVVTITACVRQTPGPLVRHVAQTLAIVTWSVVYN